VLAARREAVVLLRHREAERAELAQPGDEVLGHVAVGAVYVLGYGPDAVVGEAAERLGDQLEIVREVARTGAMNGGLVAQCAEKGG
jgi:hypothetical protein